MPKPLIPSARERLVFSRLVIGLFRELVSSMPEWYQSAGAESYLVSSAVLIGQLEKRPMTASDIANYVGLPRTTVLRKLNLMMIAGVIARKDNTYCLAKRVLNRNAQVPGMKRLILEAAAELSKMDKDLLS